MQKGYPRPELLQRYLEAYRTEGEAGIRRVMREQQEKGKYVEDLIGKSLENWEGLKDRPKIKPLAG